MRKKLNRRKATTLIEMIVVLVMMAFFIMMVFNMFNVTYDAYQFNRELAAKTYAQTNADNFFEIFEKELMYAGSLGRVIQNLNDFADKSIVINEASLTVQYALAEQLILTKKDKAYYDDIDEPSFASTELTYFPLYPAGFPEPLTNRWALAYDDISSPTTVATLNIAAITYSTATITISGTKTATMFQITDPNITNPATYISILLHEKAFDTLNPAQKIMLDNHATWTGEMIYKSTIYLDSATATKESTLCIKKEIPTINTQYEIALMDNIIDFQATETDELYIATVSYLVPGVYKSLNENNEQEASVTVTRKFLKTQ